MLYKIWESVPNVIKNLIKFLSSFWSLSFKKCCRLPITTCYNLKFKKVSNIWKWVLIKKWCNVEYVDIWDYSALQWYNTFYANKNFRVIIGKYCCIAEWASFIAAMNHNYEYLTLSDHKKLLDDIQIENVWKTITIWHDVRIWKNAIILKWVTVWTWSVIWAGAVVTKDVPPYAIVWWNPAKIIKYRFPEKTIKKLLDSKWWNWNKEKIKENYYLDFIKKSS